jgi:hypothetical protein
LEPRFQETRHLHTKTPRSTEKRKTGVFDPRREKARRGFAQGSPHTHRLEYSPAEDREQLRQEQQAMQDCISLLDAMLEVMVRLFCSTCLQCLVGLVELSDH